MIDEYLDLREIYADVRTELERLEPFWPDWAWDEVSTLPEHLTWSLITAVLDRALPRVHQVYGDHLQFMDGRALAKDLIPLYGILGQYEDRLLDDHAPMLVWSYRLNKHRMQATVHCHPRPAPFVDWIRAREHSGHQTPPRINRLIEEYMNAHPNSHWSRPTLDCF